MNIIEALRDAIAMVLREQGLCVVTSPGYSDILWIEHPYCYAGPIYPSELEASGSSIQLLAALSDKINDALAHIVLSANEITINTFIDPTLGPKAYPPPHWYHEDQSEDPSEDHIAIGIQIDYNDPALMDKLTNIHGPLATAYYYSS